MVSKTTAVMRLRYSFSCLTSASGSAFSVIVVNPTMSENSIVAGTRTPRRRIVIAVRILQDLLHQILRNVTLQRAAGAHFLHAFQRVIEAERERRRWRETRPAPAPPGAADPRVVRRPRATPGKRPRSQSAAGSATERTADKSDAAPTPTAPAATTSDRNWSVAKCYGRNSRVQRGRDQPASGGPVPAYPDPSAWRENVVLDLRGRADHHDLVFEKGAARRNSPARVSRSKISQSGRG